VLDVLSLAHAAGIIHRDIKPENVFVEWRDGRPSGRLLDFGIARRSDRGIQNLTQVGAMLGTPFYMSPEQLLGDPLDGRGALYAVGTVLYRALSGRLPYESSQLTALLREVVGREPDSLATVRPDLPPALIALVDRALRRDRDARWADARRMRDALAPFSTRAAEAFEGTLRDGASTAAAAGDAVAAPVAPIPAAAPIHAAAPIPAAAQHRGGDAGDTVWRPSVVPPRPAKEVDRRFVAAIGELEAEIAELRARHGAPSDAPARPPGAAQPARRGWFDKVLKK
jgi:serine/threonine-protein kinase